MKKLRLSKDQKGIVSFFVVMIIMVVLTLIVLAFSQLVRREQRQTLDRQLKSQALYAAESGVNDAIDWINDPDNQDDLFTWNDECDGAGSFIDTAGLTNELDGSGGETSYSCLLVDPAPDALEYSVPVETSATFRLQPDGSSINRLEISWRDGGGGTDVTCTNSVGSYPGNGNQSCTIGNIRIEIVSFAQALPTPIPPPNRDRLTNDRFIAFAQPGGTGTVGYASGTNRGQGVSVGSSCSGGACRATISSVPNITLGYMRVSAIYRDADISVEAFNGGDLLSMLGAQVEIDATGKASDVLHRIKVNSPISIDGDGPAPEYALQTRVSQCKRFSIPDADVVLFPGDPDIARCNPFQAASPN